MQYFFKFLLLYLTLSLFYLTFRKSGKEFSFNPSAKEFCPNKPNPIKPSTYTVSLFGVILHMLS